MASFSDTLDPVSTKHDAARQPAATDSDFGQRVVPTHTFETAPPLDVLIVPGGRGTRYPGISTAVDFVGQRFGSLQYLLTVCTGSGLAARAGVLDGRRATTNKLSWRETIALRPEVDWVHEARWVRDGRVWTSSGISAGIDLTFAWIGAVYGEDVAKRIADRMEYTPVQDPSWDPFANLWGSKE
ncbi:DJ-1/PfpI family protein [Colletotrichum falcatum]|nr:DJ-1/PfpI family protein [Colletotrichum falcatum]